MSCHIINGSDGRIPHFKVIERLFDGENTLEAATKGKTNDEESRSPSTDITKAIWHVKNRYYEANISIYVSNNFISYDRAQPVGAIIYYADKLISDASTEVDKENNLIVKLNSWLDMYSAQPANALNTRNESNDITSASGDDEQESEQVRLIVLDEVHSEEMKSVILKWALNKGVELIDLDEEDLDDELNASENIEANNGPKSYLRNKRVIEAIQTFPWRSMETTNSHENDSINSEPDLNKECAGGDFEELMSKLSTFKQASDSLPQNERYAFAEQIALSFYSAMGGDEEETDSA